VWEEEPIWDLGESWTKGNAEQGKGPSLGGSEAYLASIHSFSVLDYYNPSALFRRWRNDPRDN